MYFQPHLETAVPRALERAVYAGSREQKESLSDYVIRMKVAFRELASEGIKLEEQVTGYILFRQVTTWTQGKYGRDDVVKAIRKLEKVNKEKSSAKTYLAEDEVPEKEEDSEEYVSG